MGVKKLFLIVSLLFVILVLVGVFILLQLRTSQSPPSLEEVGKKSVTHYAGDPIVKSLIPEEKGVAYDLEGTFIEGLKKTKGKLLSGIFIINGDPLERKIQVYIGDINGSVFFGTYEKSFEGESNWKSVPGDVVAELIRPADSVAIRFHYEFSGAESERENLKKYEDVLDILIREFQTENFQYEIPLDFILSSARLGVVR
jgi:hypothetical protein